MGCAHHGLAGSDGHGGAQGITGLPGIQASPVRAVRPVPGMRGITGVPGVPGLTGSRGPTGPDGMRGITACRARQASPVRAVRRNRWMRGITGVPGTPGPPVRAVRPCRRDAWHHRPGRADGAGPSGGADAAKLDVPVVHLRAAVVGGTLTERSRVRWNLPPRHRHLHRVFLLRLLRALINFPGPPATLIDALIRGWPTTTVPRQDSAGQPSPPNLAALWDVTGEQLTARCSATGISRGGTPSPTALAAAGTDALRSCHRCVQSGGGSASAATQAAASIRALLEAQRQRDAACGAARRDLPARRRGAGEGIVARCGRDAPSAGRAGARVHRRAKTKDLARASEGNGEGDVVRRRTEESDRGNITCLTDAMFIRRAGGSRRECPVAIDRLSSSRGRSCRSRPVHRRRCW